ncbi:PaaI family thioesterase [Salinisphaera sp. P385]|uniref:PaaI family thioesterase n=1 Tax=Spectribacter acetivorans TaxID=3075603 RepID=A0ABU3B9R1_9GAMM|nr:PaaI family thioesterase [Salinisphaera sp. P385]MDT0619209.1 PaaI family thioesterase [Salinisphaera sp. P385]
MQVEGNIRFDIVEQDDEQVRGEMPVQPGILNPYGTVHAGATLWFADVCATVLAFGGDPATSGGKGFPLAISLNANLLGNQSEGRFRAVSTFVKRGRQVQVIRTRVTGDGDRVIAEVTTSHVAAG